MKKEDRLSGMLVSASVLSLEPMPHIRRSSSYRSMSCDVLIALMPATLFGILIFGLRAAVILAVSLFSAWLCDLFCPLLFRRPVRIGDGSALVTGLLLGLLLPVTVPLWIPAAGAAFAVIVLKHFFGGTGRNVLNPALGARVFLALCFPEETSVFVLPRTKLPVLSMTSGTDFVPAVPPLETVLQGEIPEASFFDLFVGLTPGFIGETSALFLLAGGVYLLCRRVVKWEIPLSFLAVFSAATYVFALTEDGESGAFLLRSILSGSVLLVAIFASTDPVTTPVSRWGRYVFGSGAGLLSVLLRYLLPGIPGAVLAVLILNVCATVPYKLLHLIRRGGRRRAS